MGTSYAKENGYIDARGTWIVETRSRRLCWPEDHIHRWHLRRVLLAEANETVYIEARGIAAEAHACAAGGTPFESALPLLLPFAFPDEETWSV